ncbi:formate dehydrogenase accessory sulfurtransferase FdhD [Pseudohoeflea sp. DP4N28-3]|uniref:Sulfur carrier protein FdhD n=1 Tax=Pseudohoeflea coraliihabitans TaxID=2860393 RepID=A0ABS6WRG3_9HYPH|nr:formate dehydrogenase accessory sulfurtransferase FdhD [Pseudohoeflea sp. DP4N28-3]
MSSADAARPLPYRRVRHGSVLPEARRDLPDECAVALSFNGTTQAVMMATPQDLAEFGVGFALSEGIALARADIESIEVVQLANGFDVQMRLAEPRHQALTSRRRTALGPVGCGLCGIESIADALPALPPLATANWQLPADDIAGAIAALGQGQALRQQVGAVHGAGFWQPGRGLRSIREDVGRHNALDKLIGAVGATGEDLASGAIVITSRVSVDLVQKSVRAGTPMLIAVSTPTALAVDVASAAGLTLIALARQDSFEIYSRPDRVATSAVAHAVSDPQRSDTAGPTP